MLFRFCRVKCCKRRMYEKKKRLIYMNFDLVRIFTVRLNHISSALPKCIQCIPTLEEPSRAALLIWIDISNRRRVVKWERVAYQLPNTKNVLNTKKEWIKRIETLGLITFVRKTYHIIWMNIVLNVKYRRPPITFALFAYKIKHHWP